MLTGAAAPAAGGGAPPPPVTKKVMIAGQEVEVLDTPVAEGDIQVTPDLLKEKRSLLSESKWLPLKATIETGLAKKYMEVSITETDLSALSNTYELNQQNKLLSNRLQKWDMLDVFTLVVNVVTTQDASGIDTHTAETVNLLQDWPTVDLQDVLKSNKYYNTHTSDYCAALGLPKLGDVPQVHLELL